MGGAWLVGTLHGLATGTGWDPASAEVIVGTSAGSMIGSLLASGVPPWFMVATAAGRYEEALAAATAAAGADSDAAAVIDAATAGAPTGAERVGGAVFRLSRAVPLGPQSVRLAFDAATGRARTTPLGGLVGWLPGGPISTTPLKDTIRRVVPSGWGPHPGLWVVTFDVTRGRRVVFGREGAPPAELADAVAASCAIPGFFRPVRIGDRRYVDGGVWSASNLDVVAGRGLDLVICLNPMSSHRTARGTSPAEPVWTRVRRRLHLRLRREVERVRAAGTNVVVLEPDSDELAAMGPNLMRRRGRNRVIHTAIAASAAKLADPAVAAVVADLPAGDPFRVRAPTGLVLTPAGR